VKLIYNTLFVLCALSHATPLFSQERIFHDAYVVIPEAFQGRPEWQDLVDSQTRFIRSSEDFRIRYDELAALRIDQLRILFFEIPVVAVKSGRLQDLQKRAAETFLHLPTSRMAQLLVAPELRLKDNLETSGHLVNYSQLSLAQYYADTLVLHQQEKFVRVLEYILRQRFESAPIQKAFELLQLVRSDRVFGHASQAIRSRSGLSLAQVLELVALLPESTESQAEAKNSLVAMTRSEMGLSGRKITAVGTSRYHDMLRLDLESAYTSKGEPVEIMRSASKGGGRTYAKLKDGEYVYLPAESLNRGGLLLAPSSSASVTLVLRSDHHVLAMILDPELRVEDAMRRVFQRLKLLKIDLKSMRALLFSSTSPKALEHSFLVKQLLFQYQVSIDPTDLADPVGVNSGKPSQFILRGKRIIQLSDDSLSSKPYLRIPSQLPSLLRPHPKSVDFSTLEREIRVRFPSYERPIGKVELLEMSAEELRSLFNPTSSVLADFPKDEATQLFTSLPYWMIAEILSQTFDPKSTDLFGHYVNHLRIDEPQKFEQLIVYLHPHARNLSESSEVSALFNQIFASMSPEELEDFLSRLDQGLGVHFESYSDSLRQTEEPIALPRDTQDPLHLTSLDPKEIPSAASYSYLPLLDPGSSKISLTPFAAPQVSLIKAVLVPNSIIVSASNAFKNFLAALHLRTSDSEARVHQFIDEFVETLSENASFDIETASLQILVAKETTISEDESAIQLERIQKHLILSGFVNLQSKAIAVPSRRRFLGVAVDPLTQTVFRLRKPRILELRNAKKFERSPTLATREFSLPGIEEARQSSQETYKRRVRGKCEHFVASIAKKRRGIGL
jgi:hypothetical protein